MHGPMPGLGPPRMAHLRGSGLHGKCPTRQAPNMEFAAPAKKIIKKGNPGLGPWARSGTMPAQRACHTAWSTSLARVNKSSSTQSRTRRTQGPRS